MQSYKVTCSGPRLVGGGAVGSVVELASAAAAALFASSALL